MDAYTLALTWLARRELTERQIRAPAGPAGGRGGRDRGGGRTAAARGRARRSARGRGLCRTAVRLKGRGPLRLAARSAGAGGERRGGARGDRRGAGRDARGHAHRPRAGPPLAGDRRRRPGDGRRASTARCCVRASRATRSWPRSGEGRRTADRTSESDECGDPRLSPACCQASGVTANRPSGNQPRLKPRQDRHWSSSRASGAALRAESNDVGFAARRLAASDRAPFPTSSRCPAPSA